MRLRELEQALVNAHNAGDEEGAKVLANAIIEKRQSLGMNESGQYGVPNPAAEGAFWPGVGKSFYDIGRGVGQKVGLVSADEIKESRRLDAPLMETGLGKTGNLIGHAAALAPTAFIPGANTMAGAGAIGAATGFLQPATNEGELIRNTALGGVLGPAGVAAGRGIAAGWQGAKGLIAPFFEKGQEKIAARTLQSFAGNPQAAAQALEKPGVLVRGSRPTAAELTNDAGIAQLQRTVQNADPQIAAAFSARGLANNEARATALSRIAKDEGERDLFETMRKTTAEALYGKAFRQTIPAKKWEQVAPRVDELMKRPSMQQAQERALQIAREEGVDLAPDGSVKGLHYMKKALDDMLDSAPQSGIGNVSRGAIAKTRDELIAIIDRLSPAYGKARAEYADISKKIAQMEVGQALKNKAFPALTDFGGLTRTRAGAYADAVRNADALVKRTTGFKGSNLENTMTPLQRKRIEQVAQDLARKVNSEELGRAVGSNTAQNLVSQNLLRQALGPTGLPESWAESALLQTLLRPVQFTAKAGEQKVAPRIADALLNPKEAARLLRLAEEKGLLERNAAEIARYLPAGGLLGLPVN